MLRFLVHLVPALVIPSCANAQAPPVGPNTPSAPSTNNAVVVPPPHASSSPVQPSPEFKILVPDGFGGLQQAPGIIDSAPDQTGSTVKMLDQPLSEPNSNGEP
jgi:hypothetical protein